MNLDNKRWKEFFIGGQDGIFKISSTSSGIDKNKLLLSEEEEVPYITRSDLKNGISLFIQKNQLSKYKKDVKNTITIGLDTQTVFYQPADFFTGQNIQVLKQNSLNKYNAFFLISSIKIQMKKFNWGGNGATLGRLSKTKIMLPVNKNEEPNYEYMEQYSKSIIDKKIENYKRYASEVLNEIEYKEIKKLEDVEFKDFEIGRLFNLQAGKSKGLNHLQKVENFGINYLGATNLNNGVLTYVERNKQSQKMIQEGNCIAFIRNGNGSAGYSVYKHEYFIATSDISVGYSDFLNKYVGLFITTIADKARSKYSFGYKRSATRLKKEKIILPVNENEEPDYEYMEQYMKNMTYRKMNQYLNYTKRKRSV